MIVLAVALAVTAVALAVPVPLLLARARWTERAPMRALLLWQAIAWVGGISTVGVPIVLGEAVSRIGLATGVVVGSGVALYLAGHVLATIARREARRRRHLTLLDLLATATTVHGARVIEQEEPVAYCVPRPRQATIVVSTGLVARLAPGELEAVIAHERAHARQRHDVLLLAFAAWRSALPRLTAARVASEQVARLVELAADDRARRQVGTPELIRAILHNGVEPGRRERERVTRLLHAGA
jgi:Zn-dependent protease with chaperone function